MTVKEAAEYLGVSQQTIYMAIHKGQLTGGEKTGKTWDFSQGVLDAYREYRGEDIVQNEIPLEEAEEDTKEERAKKEIAETVKRLTTPEKTTRYAIERDEAEQEEYEDESVEQPICHRCQRPFLSTREYTIKKFIENAKPAWYPVCRDGRCDPTLINARQLYQQQLEEKKEKKRSNQLLLALRKIRDEIDAVITQFSE